jgi:hypothetical protein
MAGAGILGSMDRMRATLLTRTRSTAKSPRVPDTGSQRRREGQVLARRSPLGIGRGSVFGVTSVSRVPRGEWRCPMTRCDQGRMRSGR